MILSGYQITEQIFESINSTIYRGTRKNDNKSVIIKVMNNEYPTAEEMVRFKREFEIIREAEGNKIIKVYGIEVYKNGFAIIMEDINGKSMSQLLKTKELTTTEKLALSINLTDALMQIHLNNIIHKDINPSNIVWNTENNELRIVDFGISTWLSMEKPQNLSILEGTIPYVSPEQTGKVNRGIDYRSDFYSLGVTFYEIFTGKLPFEGDELEIIYSHIARMPELPLKVNKEIPRAISDIIMKLLAKNSEKRYQNILGLKYDLMFCLENLNKRKEIDDFKIGKKDVSNKFQIPQKLYGREKEIKILTESFNGMQTNKIKLLLVSGYSGIGKTTVIREMYKIIADKGGYFTWGKFSMLERNNPYSGIVWAFESLIKSIILEYGNIELWKQKITNALGSNGKIMVDLIPYLKEIIGEQPEIPFLNPVEEKNRFQMVFRDFIKVFAQKSHPLVIFLDDLQWSDFSTIDLLKYLLISTDVNNLLLIGAYRNNEVKEGHPLLKMLHEIKNISGEEDYVRNMVLEPLKEDSINQIVSDTLKCNPKDTLVLSSYIFRKTQGNPFFVNQLLVSLHHRGIFKFNKDNLKWEWDLNEIEKVGISNNVVDFLVETLYQLPNDTLEVLKRASCIGNTFDLKTLYLMWDESEDICKNLTLAMKKDFIVPGNNNYMIMNMPKDDFLNSGIDIKFRFSHDRIQQGVYSLIPDNQKRENHYRTGKILLELNKINNSIEVNIFDIVNHLNLAKNLVENRNIIELVNLNYIAGNKARINSAYEIASNYFMEAIYLLTIEQWQEYPDMYFKLSYGLAEINFLGGNLDKSMELCQKLLEDTEDIIGKARVYALKSKILDIRGEKREEVIEEIRKALNMFQFFLPENFSDIDRMLGESIGNIAAYLSKSGIEELLRLPKMTDKNKIMIMNLLFQVQPATFQSYPPLNFLIQLKMFDMALNYGTTDVSCKNYTECGIILGAALSDYEMGYKLNQCAFALIEKYNARYLEAGCYFIFAAFISHWRAHYKEGLDYYDLSVKRGLETGDMEHASYSCTHKVHRILYVGMNLEYCRGEANKATSFLNETKVSLLLPLIEVFVETINGLQKNYDHEYEKLLFDKLIAENNMFILCTFGQCKLMVNYILGNIEEAIRWNTFTEPYLQGGTGFYPVPDHIMFQSLLLVKLYENGVHENKEEILVKISNNIEKLKLWSENCPQNFSHKYFLICGEMARIKNEPQETITNFYKSALKAIPSGDFINMKALINQLAGEFWLSRDEELIGKTFIKEAYYFYKLWGALSKVKLIEKRYRHFFFDNKQENESRTYHGTTSTYIEGAFDIGYILKATQAISKEIKIDMLLKVLMNTIVECAGAQKGCLILKEDSKGMVVEANKNTDSEEVEVLKSVPVDESGAFCPQIVQYVIGTGENIVLDNANNNMNYGNNEYIKLKNIKSVLCMPVVHKNQISGVVYLENNLMENVFTLNRIELLKIILSQISISIENARLYEKLEEKVKERTKQLEVANNELKELALHDPLTKLYNRRYLYEFVSDLSENFIKHKTALLLKKQKRDLSIENNVIGVFLIDIDFFKSVNDSYGHAAGDKVLVKIAEILKGILREEDYIIRWGGEEFLIVLNKSKVEYLKVFSKKVLELLRNTPIEISESESIYKTCSLGCTHLPFDARYPELLSLEQNINICDFAMYMAKNSGRNKAIHITPQRDSKYTEEEMRKYILNLTKGDAIDCKLLFVEEIT